MNTDGAKTRIALPQMPEGPARHYALIVFALSASLAAWMLWQGIGPASLALLATSVVLVLWRSRLLCAILPALLIWPLAQISDYDVNTVGEPPLLTQSIVCCACLALIMATLRLQSLTRGIFPIGIAPRDSGRVDDVSSSRLRDSETFDSAELVGLPLLVVILGGVAMFWGTWAEADPLLALWNYGLQPKGLTTVRLMVSLFLVFVLLRSIVSYAWWTQMSEEESILQLQHIVWQWCANEQRLVRRLERRHRRQ